MEELNHIQLLNCPRKSRFSFPEIAWFEKSLDCIDCYRAHKTIFIFTFIFLFLKKTNNNTHKNQIKKTQPHPPKTTDRSLKEEASEEDTYRIADWGSERLTRLPKPARSENGFGKALLFVLLFLHGFIFRYQQFLQKTKHWQREFRSGGISYSKENSNILLTVSFLKGKGKRQFQSVATAPINRLHPSYELNCISTGQNFRVNKKN